MGTETNQKLNKQEEEDNIPRIAICSFAVITIIMILLGIMMCELPVVMVCSIVILETLIAVCLHNLPIWVHVMILAAEVTAGILCTQLVFIVLACIVYATAILALHFIEE